MCFSTDPYRAHMGIDRVDRDQAFEAWRWMMRSASFGGNVFEEEPTSGPRTIGCGAAVFVQPAFARAELANPQPGLNGRIVSSIVERIPVVLDYDQLREINTQGNLDLVVLIGSYAEHLREEEVWEATTVMSGVFVSHYAGYNIGRIIY